MIVKWQYHCEYAKKINKSIHVHVCDCQISNGSNT